MDNPHNTLLGKCYQCGASYKSCLAGSPPNYAYVDQISTEAYNIVSGMPVNRCPSSTWFNVENSVCNSLCKTGCSTCSVTTDFCTGCEPGYVWYNHTCLPAVVGLEAAALALLVVSLIFGIMIIVRSGGK